MRVGEGFLIVFLGLWRQTRDRVALFYKADIGVSFSFGKRSPNMFMFEVACVTQAGNKTQLGNCLGRSL